MTRKTARAWTAGFTLVEALAATLVMSFILASLAIITERWLPNWDRGTVGLQRADLLTLGLARITDDLAAAEFISSDAEDKFPIFDGSDLYVTFVRSTLAPNAGVGLELVRIAVSSDNTGLAVVRSTAPLPTGSGEVSDTSTLVFSNPVSVFRGPYRMFFSYAGPDRVWHNTWQGQPQLPHAARILLRDSATSEVLTASTSVLIHAELPARCSWPASTGACPELADQLNTPGTPGSGTSGSGTPGAH